MRSIRYWGRLLSTFSQKFRLLLLLSAVVGVLAFLFLPKAQNFFVAISRGENIGLVGRFTTDTLPLEIQSEISMGLTQIDEEGNVQPGLAESWQHDEDGRIWVFKLGDHKWQDGTKIQAYDINYKFSDVTAEVLDAQTIKFVLEDPFSPFPAVTARPVFKSGFLGAGEWRATKISSTPDGFVETIKLASIDGKRSKVFKFYPTEEAARIAFKLGEIGELRDMVNLRDLAAWKNVDIKERSREDRYVGIFINNQDPILSGKNARQALAYATNKAKFSEERAISPISPQSWAFNPQVKPYLYNPTRAKELLDELPDEQRNGLSIKLVTTPTLLNIADKIKEDWDAIGLTTHVQVSNALPDDFQTLLAIQAIPPDPDQYSFWHSTQTKTNLTKYRSSKESQRIDKLLEDGRGILDQDERQEIYQDFQRFLVEDSPVIFLFHPVTYTITKK